MKTKTIFPLALIAALCVLFFSSGCNTVNGAGKDIEKAGDKIQDAAQRNK